MFIINPYRYAATGPQPITDFYGSIHTSSLYFTLGVVGQIYSGSIHTSSLEFTIGAVAPDTYTASYIMDSVELSIGPSREPYLITETITDTVEIIVT